MTGFTELERELYINEYSRWKSSPWGRMQCRRVKFPSLPIGMRYKRAVAISQGLDPNSVYEIPPTESQYEQIFLDEHNAKTANHQT